MNKCWVVAMLILLGCTKEKLQPKVLVYGHAGATLNEGNWIYPPNSLEAILYGIHNLQAEGVEVDVQMTKDSVLVLFHDDFLSPAIDLEGCVADYNWSELEGQKIYNTRFELIRLKDIKYIPVDYNKNIFLDLKHHNACNGVVRSVSAYNYALNDALAYPQYYVFNSRNLTFLNGINTNGGFKALETDDLEYGIATFQSGAVEELTLRASTTSEADAQLLRDLNIPFTIFGAVSQKELRAAVALQPTRIITDNIAYTNKITQ